MSDKIISLDASTSCSGYSIYQNNKFIQSGIIETNKKIKGDEKLNQMIDLIHSLLKYEKPSIIVCEKIVVTRNALSTRMLQELTGAIRGFCIEHNIDYVSLAPASWRSIIVKEMMQKPNGRKREDQKAWALDIINNKLGIETVSTDEAEAILIGRAYLKGGDLENEK